MKNMLSRRRTLSLASGVLASPFIASGIARAAEEWPSRPVRYINSFPAGGPTDALSRIVCEKLAELTGQPFVVENKGGSGGNVGAEAIARAAPDGYTIGLYSVASHAIAPTLYATLPFDADKDFTAVSMLWSLPNLLIVRPDLRAKTVPELIRLVRGNPGKYSFASSGAGTTVHLSGELFKEMARIDLVHVPYRGSAPAIEHLLAGQVDIIFDNIPTAMAQVRVGKAVGLAVTSLRRSPAMPEMPAMAEFFPGFDVNSWGGICGPAGLPPAMVEKLSALTQRALESDDVKRSYLRQGAEPNWLSPIDTAAWRATDERRLAPVIKASGAKVE